MSLVKRIVAYVGYPTARLPRWPLLLGLALTLLIPRPVIGQGDPAGASSSQSELLWHQSSALFPIRVYLPEDFDSERPYPAVIALHGFGGSSERLARIGMAFAQAGFIAALPEGPYPILPDEPGRHSTWELSTWTEEYGLGPPLTDDPAIEVLSGSLTVDDFFPSVIDRVRKQYRVGPIYVFGFSLGGVYALVNGFHNRDQVDGIIAFGATYYRGLFTARGDRLEDGNRLKIRWVLGRADPMVPFSNAERARDAFAEAGYEVVLDEFDGGHTVPDDALMRAVTWLRDLANRQVVIARQFQRYAEASASLSGAGPATSSATARSTALAASTDEAELPRIRVLGTVQDGGLPHAACDCVRCRGAREDPAQARLVASLAILLPRADRAYLVDATPDIRAQLERLRALRGRTTGRTDRRPVDGVLLTHAHWGHYTGLGFFGFEAVHTDELPVHCTPAMARFLESNAPWSQLVRLRNVVLRPLEPGRALALGEGVHVTPLRVPHRDEYADTVGWIVEGPRRRVLYAPDTDSWSAWEPPLLRRIAGVDVAIVDGTFFSTAELPDREVDSIGHPLMRETMELLEERVRDGGLRVYFTHLNHSNPTLDPRSPERLELERRGFRVLSEGQRIDL